jgi:hypothetical protein
VSGSEKRYCLIKKTKTHAWILSMAYGSCSRARQRGVSMRMEIGDFHKKWEVIPSSCRRELKRRPDVAMEVGTHTGSRLRVRGICEVCNTPTNWVVNIQGRTGAYWCGCGNAHSTHTLNHTP